MLRQVRCFTLDMRAGTSITIALRSAHIDAGWLCHGGLWGAAHRQNIALHAMRGKARGRARAYHLAHRAAQAMGKTVGCWETSTPSAARPGSGRDEARAALREPARRTRCGKMLSGREREEGHAFSLPPAPRQGPQAAAAGARRGRVKAPRPLTAGFGPRAPRAARAAGAASTSASRHYGRAMLR